MKPVRDIVSVIGKTRGRPPYRPFGIKQGDRMHHLYLLGQTGTGKTTLLHQLIRQDIANRQGFCLLDPHGDLARTVARECGDRAIYWDVADPACPYGYNPIPHVAERHRPLVASGLIDTLKKQWSDAAWGPRMEHLLRFSLLALVERPNSSLRDIVPMLLDKDFRREVLQSVTDPQVRQFWELEYRAMNFKNAADGVAPIANKLGAFLAHPVVRRAMCEPEKPLRFRQLMDEGTCFVVNLSKGRLGADVSNVVGGLIVSNLAHAALSRQDIGEADRLPYFLYADEFHSLTSNSFADMLPELRKFGLALNLAHTHTAQLDAKVLEAVLGNVGTIVAFRLGTTDASMLAKQFGADIPTPRDLVNLANYEMFIKLMVDGAHCGTFSGSTGS